MTPPSRRRVMGGVALLAAAAAGRRSIAWAAAIPAPIPPTPIPPATIDDDLEIEGESLAARLARTRLSVQVLVNKQGPFRFVVDSGADRTVIGLGVARALRLPPDRPVTLTSTTGITRVETVRIDTLGIGGSDIRDLAAPALPERFIGAQGLLGIDALADQRLMLDFDAHRIVVQDSRRARQAPPASDEIVVTARRRNGQLIITQAGIGHVRIAAILDSGAEVTLGNGALRDRLYARHRLPPVTPLEIVSVTGDSATIDSIVLPDLTLGGVRLADVPMAFYDSPPFALFGLAHEPAILLGTDILRAFSSVNLDFRARRVRFRLRGGGTARR